MSAVIYRELLALGLARCAGHRFTEIMATKTTFVCDSCFREAHSNLGWAHLTVNGAADGKQLMRTSIAIYARSVGARFRLP